ncbi:hypothetical protein, partial [Paraburkholderia aspalathi]|uniref:hypothetical protein n=1 Tax=Paraburkholderia aspalathi TaxID=1324617 RepID=UPI0038B7DDD2
FRATIVIRCPVMAVALAVFHFTPERDEHLLPPRLERSSTPQDKFEQLAQLRLGAFDLLQAVPALHIGLQLRIGDRPA